MLPRADSHICFGPFRSPRLGRALGVNVLPAGLTVCNLACAYCLHGGSGARRRRESHSAWPSPAAIEGAVAARLRQAADAGEWLDRITVAGHGESTLHPEFEDVVERLSGVRARLAPDIPLAILSNSTTATWRDVRRGLLRFDERYMKLDAGDPITFARLNGPGPSIADTVDALASLGPLVLQSTFVRDRRGRVDNTSDGAVHDWTEAVVRIRPRRVELFTLARTAALGDLTPVPLRRLREIAEHVRASGTPADIQPRR